MKFLLCGATDALRLVKAKQAVVELTDNIFCRQEVIEHPLLPECLDVCSEDGRRVRAERTRLVYSDENVFELQGFKLEISGLSGVTEGRRIPWILRVIVYVSTI